MLFLAVLFTMDTKAIEELLKKEPLLARFFDKHERKLDLDSFAKQPFPAIVAAIIGQKISFSKACKIRSELYSLLSDSKSFTADDMAKLTDAQLLSTGMSRATLEKIKSVQKLFKKQGNVDIGTVLSLHGIGKWTLATTKLTIEPRLDIFPYADYFIRKKIRDEFRLSALPSVSAMREMSEKWSPWRGIVAWYIWRDL
jgi:DNA-3-methyladenine glycosylase II